MPITIGSRSVTTEAREKAKDQATSAFEATPMPDYAGLQESWKDVMLAAIDLWLFKSEQIAIEKYIALQEYRKEQLEKRKAELQKATAQGETQAMWCADYTLDLSGDVDSIEIIGAPTQVLIGPAGASALTPGASSRLAKIMAMSPAQSGLAWALLPGWQKWRPTYRVGSIHSIDYDNDTASVTLDEAVSIAQGLKINQTTELTAVDVVYMTCNAAAFEADDRVVVEFPGQLWQRAETEEQAAVTPRVIGFETHPKPCGGFPAFHTFDAAGNFIGLTVCTSGKWGEPYEFVACSEDEIYDFDYGLWNTWSGATEPVDYVARNIPGGYREIPAVHKYAGGISGNGTETVIPSSGTYTSSPFKWFLECTTTEAHGYWHRYADWRYLKKYFFKMVVVTDWDVFDSWGSGLPLVEQWSYILDEDGTYTAWENAVSVYGDNPLVGTACEVANAELDAMLGGIDWEPDLNSYSWTTWSYNITESDIGTEAESRGATFADEEGTGSYLVGVTNRNDIAIKTLEGRTTSADFPNNIGEPSTTISSETSSHDKVVAFGAEYILAEFTGEYSAAANQITIAKPRIYRDGEEKITLVSMYRAPKEKWEYLCFRDGVAQYNDPAAMYHWISGTRHELPITVDGQPVFGNGEFSYLGRGRAEEE